MVKGEGKREKIAGSIPFANKTSILTNIGRLKKKYGVNLIDLR